MPTLQEKYKVPHFDAKADANKYFEGVLPEPVLVQLCMGVPWGAPDDLPTLLAMVNNVPDDWIWSALSRTRI